MHSDQTAIQRPRAEGQVALPIANWFYQFRRLGNWRRKIRVREQGDVRRGGQQPNPRSITLAAILFVMNRKFWIVAGLIIVAASVAGGFRTRATRHRTPSVSSNAAISAAEKFEADRIENDYREAISTVEENYAGEIDYEKATQAAIQGMLFTLDPHSVFFPTVEFKKLKEDQASSFYGIGVQITRHDDGVYVQSVADGTTAARAGLRYGDRIVEVDGKDARDWTSDEVSKNVRGERGKDVKLKVERAGEEAAINFKIVRDAVPLPSIRNAFMISPGTGFVVLLSGFQHTTDDELRESIPNLKMDGVLQLILDLRNNTGGLFEQAIDVASEFLPRDKVIVSVKGRSEYHEAAVYKSNGSDPERSEERRVGKECRSRGTAY